MRDTVLYPAEEEKIKKNYNKNKKIFGDRGHKEGETASKSLFFLVPTKQRFFFLDAIASLDLKMSVCL